MVVGKWGKRVKRGGVKSRWDWLSKDFSDLFRDVMIW